MDKAFCEKRIAELEAEAERLSARSNQLAGAAAAYREVLEQLEMEAVPVSTPPAPPPIAAASEGTLQMCDYCGKGFTGPAFKSKGNVYCGMACLDTAAQGA